jgi:hypothetical protein
MNDRIYKSVKSVPGLEVTRNGDFRYKGRTKKVIYCFTKIGRKATARVVIMIGGKSHYWQAAKLMAETWLTGYKPCDYIVYRDGDIHNIKASNLIIEDKKGYYKYMRRNSVRIPDSFEIRKQKLQLVADEALMTKRYFETLEMNEINAHVKDYLYPCLMLYTLKTLHLGERTALEQVPEALARMYECIMNGMCLFNYERFCKKLLHNYKKKGEFGFTGNVPKPIKIEIEQINLDCLWEKFKVVKHKH